MQIDLNLTVKNFDGSDISGVSLRAILLQYLGTFSSQNGKEMIVAYALGQKVYAADREIELTEDDVKVIKEALKVPQHVAIVYAQVCELFDIGEEDVIGVQG